MLEIEFPRQNSLQLDYLVCDINGTLTLDGQLIDGVAEAVGALKGILEITLLSADTLGKAGSIASTLGVALQRVTPGNEARQKASYISGLGAKRTAAIGQGANDALMLKQAALGICVLSREGTASSTLVAADLVVPDVLSAFDLFTHPKRILATLRR